MTKSDRLAHLMNIQTLVKVTNPDNPFASWEGTLVALGDSPSLLLEREDGSRLMVPQSFTVTPAEPVSKAPTEPLETTAGSEQRPDHTGVIRDAERAIAYGEAIYDDTRGATGRVRKVIALADAEQLSIRADLRDVVLKCETATYLGGVARDAASKALRDASHEIALQDLVIEKLTAQRDAANDEANRLTGVDKWASQDDPRPTR